MRVAHVNADPGIRPGSSKGAWVHVQAMRDAFAALGAEVIAIDEPDPRRLRERLAQAGPLHLIYERFALRADQASAHAEAHATPYALEVNAPLDEEEARHRPGVHQGPDLVALRRQLRRATSVLCVSKEVARWARERGARLDRLATVGNAVDVQRFQPERRAAGVRAKLGLEDAFVLGFHGRLRPWHGFESICRVASTLVRRGVPAHVLTVGRGDYAAQLEAHLPARHFTCVPWVDHAEVGDWVAAFDALALAYPPDQPCYFSPLKLLEAMASGVPVVVPRLGDLPEVVEQGRCGRLFTGGDEEALADALADLYQAPAEARALAARGIERAGASTWTAIAARLLDQALEGVP